jgi:hypothetical protein
MMGKNHYPPSLRPLFLIKSLETSPHSRPSNQKYEGRNPFITERMDAKVAGPPSRFLRVEFRPMNGSPGSFSVLTPASLIAVGVVY